jgi:hypothetical protein
MHETDALAELTLADLVADAAQITLPRPRTPERLIDLTAHEPGGLTIPDSTVSLMDGYADYGV